MNYPIDIPSIAQIHPALANNLNIINVPVMQGIFSSKVVGAPVDPIAVDEAEETVQMLVGATRQLPDLINHNVIELAKNRVHLLRETHSAMQFGLQPGLAGIQPFLQEQFGQLNARFEQLNARFEQLDARFEQQQAAMCNIRIVARNQRDGHRFPPRPLQKYIPGDGHALAMLLVVNLNAAIAQAVQDFQPHGLIGAVPPQFNSNVDSYQHVDILRLVVFYNDDFGIHAGDNLLERKFKLRLWLTEHLV